MKNRLHLSIVQIVLSITSTPWIAQSAACPELAPLRTNVVTNSFVPEKLSGLWYEWAYTDPAQIGSSCQTLNASLKPDGIVDMAFRVTYGKIPFTIVEIYTPTNTSGKGIYIKRAQAPGSKLLELPSVFVDVTGGDGDEPYDTMSIFTCATKVGIEVKEVILAGRTPSPPNNTAVGDMEQVLVQQQVPVDVATLKRTNRTGCPSL
eukprot:m.145814 g.145814  ORF g.145814 m.145814 type:complete len:205 (+) comp17743_c0_seq3:293-907(+)